MNENLYPDRSARVRAFTLVELLVVIGIIALLISILLPSLNSARRAAQSTVCLAQLRQLGVAITGYAVDNRGHVVPTRVKSAAGNDFWSVLLIASKYIPKQNTNATSLEAARSVLVCPSIRNIKAIASTDTDGYSQITSAVILPNLVYDVGYAINGSTQYTAGDGASSVPDLTDAAYRLPATAISFSPAVTNAPLKKMSQLKTSDMVILFDGWSYNPSQELTINGAPTVSRITGARHGRWRPERVTTSGSTNLLFLDGHAASYNRADLPQRSTEYIGTRVQMIPASRVLFNVLQQ